MTTIHSYRDLIVWQRSMQLVIEMYRISEFFPKSELYGLTSQMRRAAVSIPSNIAEGRRRRSQKEFLQFLQIAYGSGGELETQIEIVKQLPFGLNIDFKKLDAFLNETMRMLNSMLIHLRS